MILISLKRPNLRKTTEWLLPSNLQHSLVQHFVAWSSEFTEHFSGLNKVHYSIYAENDFTVVITSVVGGM